MSYSSNYDKLCGYFTLSSPDNLNPLRRTGPGGTGPNYPSILYFSNAVVTYYNNENFQQNRFNSPLTNVPFQSNYTFSICSNANIGSNICFTLSNLMPNMQYSFNVYVTNTCNPRNGFLTSNSAFVTTPFPPPPPRLELVTIYNDEYYENLGQTINTPRQFIGKILRYSSLVNTGGICNVINGGGALAIINNCNVGQSGAAVCTLTTICGTDTNSVTFNGFTSADYDPPDTGITSNSIIIINSIEDTYTGITNLNNFYIQCSNVNIIITSNFLQPGSNEYFYTIRQTNTGGQPNINCNLGPFYVDSINQNPSLQSYISFNDHREQSAFVSGVLVNSNSNSYQFYFDCLNFASNFLPYNKNFASHYISLSTYNSAINRISSNSLIYNTDCNIISNVPVPQIIRLSNTIATSLNIPEDIIIHTTNEASLPRLSITLTNIQNTAVYTNTRYLYYYYDTLSLRNLRVNFSNAFAPGGMRIESFSNSFNNTVHAYDQSKFLLGEPCNLYNFELPFVGGFYRTGGNLGNIFNILHNFIQPGGFEFYTYPDYRSLRTELGYRVATFKYSFSNSSIGSISALQFNINLNAPFLFTSSECNFNINQVPFLRYKVDNTGLYNTGWLDGNSVKADSAPFTFENASNNAPGLLSNPTQYPINGTSRYWSIIPIPTNCNYDVYVKIGLIMSCNLFFDFIYLNNAFGVTPLAPTNISFTVFTTPTTMILNWSNAYRLGDPDILCNAINVFNITDGYYPRRWVVSGSRTSNDTYIREIASNTSNIFTLLNADTIYQANISNQNIIGYGLPGTSIAKTDLPIQTLGGFYDSSFNFTNYYDSVVNPYYTNCNGYSYIDRAVSSNIFYNSNLFPLPTNYLQVNMSPSFIVNTSNSILTSNYPGIYLSNFTFYGYGSNNNVMKSSSYGFVNSLYSNVALTSDSGNNNSGVTLTLSNMGDIYTGCNYFSGYFYKSALSLKLQSNYLVASNKSYNVGFSNNYDSNILTGAPIWIDNFQNNLLPTVQNMFVDSNNLASLDVNSVPIRFTYSTGVLIFSSSFNPFTIQSNTTYDFWLHAKNVGSNFFINSPYQFSFSNNTNIIYTYRIPFNLNTVIPFTFSLQSFINATSVIADFPINEGNGYGIFDCLINGGQPSTTQHGGIGVEGNGIEASPRNGNTFNIWIPSQYSLPYFYVYVTYDSSLPNLSFDPINTEFYNSATIGDTLTSGAMNISSNTFFLFSNLQMNVHTFTTSNIGIYMFGSATNQNGSSSVSSNLISTASGLPLLFDDPSINVLYLTQSAFSSNYVSDPGINDNYGYRVTSGAGLYPAVGTSFNNFGVLFNNNSNLLVGTYSNELQLTNGLFTSFLVSNSYLNYGSYYNPIPTTYSYPNYTTVNTEQMRYTTFMWYISSDSVNNVDIVSIVKIIIINNNFTTSNDNNGFPILNDGITIQCKIIGNNPDETTGWINANSFFNYFDGTPLTFNDGDPGGIDDAESGYNTDVNNRYIYIRTGLGAGIPPFTLYFRIGIPVNSSLSFNSVRLVI